MAIAQLTKKQRDEVQKLIDAATEAADTLRTAVQDIVDEWDADVGEKSEKWAASDDGEAAHQRCETLREYCDQLESINELAALPDDL